MIKILIIFTTSLFVLSSCSVEKVVKEEIALLIPKKDIEKPAEKKGPLFPEKPLAHIKQWEVIPPEEEVRKPGEKLPTEQPGIPGEKVKGLAGTIITGEKTGELVEGAAAVLDEESEIDEDREFMEEFEKEMAVLFGRPFKEEIVLFPFDNLSKNRYALKQFIPVLTGKLEERGFKVLEEDKLYNLLCRKRVRSWGQVSRELGREIKEEFGIKTALTGSIISFSPGRNPKLGILARLIDLSSGRILWANHTSVTGDEFTGILGLGMIESMNELLPKAADMLLSSFSIQEYQDEPESDYKIAVMPFKNISRFRNAGKITTRLFLNELLNVERFEPVEYGTTRKVIVDLRIRSKGELEYKSIEALSNELGLNGVLVGTVENYADSSNPKVTITARLLDARKKKIVWYNSLQLSGESDVVVFEWGRLRTADKVASRLVSKLVEEMVKQKWR
jgi:TolB-like protein